MGSTMSIEDRNTINKTLDGINRITMEELDIGLKCGSTGYLDFINPSELGSNNIMKGIDSVSRKFYVFKAILVYPNGKTKKTFTTFFQRFSDDELLWHCCGHFGENLMSTEGGANLEQIKMIYQLFSSGEYQIDRNLIDKQKLNFKINKTIEYDDLTNDDYPIIVKLSD
jgi:hypothetical protein